MLPYLAFIPLFLVLSFWKTGTELLTCFAAVHCEAAFLACVGLAQPQALGHNFAGISRTWTWCSMLWGTSSLGEGVHKH